MTEQTSPTASGESAFTLDARLAADTLAIGDLSLSRVLLMNDDRFPWLILVPRRDGLTELVDLTDADYQTLNDEIRAVSRAMQLAASPFKLNVAALGNAVRQLHVHVIARSKDDAAWPGPVWGVGAAEPYAEERQDPERARWRAALGLESN